MNKDNKSKPGASSKTEQHPVISTGRLWLFRSIAAVVIPVLTLVLLNIALYAIGYGYPASAVIKCRVDNQVAYCSNNKFGWQFFPPKVTREFESFVVPAEKSDNTYRIFVLGESAAQGAPEPAYCFGRQLRVILRQRYPSANFEVFTAAMPAINSHAVVQIAEDCARLKPDLFVVYMGNNEVIGPYGAGTIFAPLSKRLPLIRMGLAVKRTRIGELMTSIAGSMKKSPEHWGGLDMFLAKQIRHDDEQMQYVYSHFRSNLEDIIRSAQKAGAKTVVSTIAVNLKDCPPFSSLHRPNLGDQQLKQFDGFFQHGIEFEKAGDFNSAIDSYLSAAKFDDTYAELQFRIGRCLWNLGQFDKAGENYARAMEFDTLRFRADSSINQIIREVSANKTGQGIYFVDAAGAFAQSSPNNCPGYELFLEHVHLNFSGNYLLARTVFECVDQILPETVKKQKVADVVTNETDCAKLMAYTDYDNFFITQGNFNIISQQPTFINQIYHDETANFWRQKTEQIKVSIIDPGAINRTIGQYEAAIKLDSDDITLRWRYVKYLSKSKMNLPVAVTQLRHIVKQMPQDVIKLIDLAEMEYKIGDNDSALEHAVKAVKLNSVSVNANYSAGMMYEKKGQYEKAEKYLTKAIKLEPTFVYIYKSLILILEAQGKVDQAEQVYRKGIEAVPTDASLHFNLALLLKKKGQLEEAEKEHQKAISLDPNLISPRRPATSR